MALNIYEPLNFKTQGIQDLATRTTLVVSDGKITVDVIEPSQSISFAGKNFSDIEGKGLKWTDGNKTRSLVFKNSKIWSDLRLNLAEDRDYQINDVSVLSYSELGKSVTKSHLKSVGVLKSLEVEGSVELGQFTYINSELNRVGINTSAPAAALGIRENNVELVLGSYKPSTAVIGTANNGNLDIITDNSARITIGNNGDVTIYGKLIVDEIVSNRISPLVFKETAGSTIYGKGIIWAGTKGPNRQFIYQANPDRIWTSESIELAADKALIIESIPILTKTALGASVTESNLSKLGVLRELQVQGDAAVTRKISTSRLEINRLAVTESGLEFVKNFKVQSSDAIEFQIGKDITIGTPNNQTRSVSVHGNLTVGVSNPDPGMNLTVAGPFSFSNKKFLTGSSAPTSGQFNKGDIVWNDDPKPTDFIGWVCITSGTPGQWMPFGVIANNAQ